MTQHPKEQLYQSFAELIYAVAMADGIVVAEERKAIKQIAGDHPMISFIDNLFDARDKPSISIVSAYYKVRQYIKENKPDPEFSFLVQVLEALSKLSEGVADEEENLVEEFVLDLKEKLKY
jgi:hypothetical protein